MRLHVLHPDVAARSCADCQKYLYIDKPGGFADEPMRDQLGQPRLRPVGARTPCSWCEKQPDTVPERERRPDTAAELTRQNQSAYQHYLECRAVGVFPDDAIVRRHAAVIRSVEDAAERIERMRLAALSIRR